MPAATRVTHERPALERITMERAALVPHPRWRRFVARVTQPRVMVAIGAVALLLGGGAIYASQQLLSNDEGTAGPHVARSSPARSRSPFSTAPRSTALRGWSARTSIQAAIT